LHTGISSSSFIIILLFVAILHSQKDEKLTFGSNVTHHIYIIQTSNQQPATSSQPQHKKATKKWQELRPNAGFGRRIPAALISVSHLFQIMKMMPLLTSQFWPCF
jgi:hypothetical protein